MIRVSPLKTWGPYRQTVSTTRGSGWVTARHATVRYRSGLTHPLPRVVLTVSHWGI